MRNLQLTLLTLFIPLAILAQGPPPMSLPQASPAASVSQDIGITKITIEFNRPGLRGRAVLGNLVPYDEMWRAGANENTTISFDKNVSIGGKEIPSGTYGLHMMPGEKEWTIILNRDHESWGSYFYDESKDIVRVKSEIIKTEARTEWLNYGFEDISNDGATVYLYWDDFKIGFPVSVNTKSQMVDYLENEYLKGLAGFSWQGFNAAAQYTLANSVSMEKGLEWADRSITMNKGFGNLATKSLILRKMGKTDEAESVIKEAKPFADEVSMNAYGYGLLYNLKDVDEAIKVFSENVKTYPKSWNVYDSLAEALATKGDKKAAIKNYEKALSMAPDNQKQRINNTIKNLKS